MPSAENFTQSAEHLVAFYWRQIFIQAGKNTK